MLTEPPRVVTMTSLLLIEDDPNVSRLVRDGLSPDQYRIDHAATIADGSARLQCSVYDIVVLDLNLPDGDGLDLAKAMRSAGNNTPIIMLTARSDVDQRLDGFTCGADDYLCKPFSVDELAARIQAVARRASASADRTLRYADLELNLIDRTVRRRDLEATLSAREMDLLIYLINHAEEVIPRQAMLEEVWGASAENDSNVLNVYVNYLRNKIERGRHERLIHTVRGVGFLLSTRPPQD